MVPLDSIGFQTCLEKPPRIIGCLTSEMFPQHKGFEELWESGETLTPSLSWSHSHNGSIQAMGSQTLAREPWAVGLHYKPLTGSIRNSSLSVQHAFEDTHGPSVLLGFRRLGPFANIRGAIRPCSQRWRQVTYA